MTCIRFLFSILFLGLLSCSVTKKQKPQFGSDKMVVVQISPHVYKHISYLSTKSFGNVACNGAVVISNNEALVIDAPTDDSGALLLIQWITNTKKSKIKGVVCTHFHKDCLGGINTFHNLQIPSYANATTLHLAKTNGSTPPKIGFTDSLVLRVGDLEVINCYLGAGHTKDNIVSYIPIDSTLFGGCLIKSIGSGKGNLEDAVISEWPNTVLKIKDKFPEARLIIPGHGLEGDTALLDYTINLFKVP